MRIEDMDYVISPKTGKKIDVGQLIKDQEMAKLALCSQFRFFNRLADKLTPIYTWEVNTQATDGTRLFINPEFTSNLSMQEKIFVFAHEIMHCALDHLQRAKLHGHEPHRSNIAGDYEINSLLALDGIISAPKIKSMGALHDSKYDGWGYEMIYADNPKGGDQDNSQYNSNNSKIEYDNDFIKGYEQAIQDYLDGKLKL